MIKAASGITNVRPGEGIRTRNITVKAVMIAAGEYVGVCLLNGNTDYFS